MTRSPQRIAEEQRNTVRRVRTRDFAWWDARERAETVACPPRPRGCRAPIGQTCRDERGRELGNQPAHLARLRLAGGPEPDAAGGPR